MEFLLTALTDVGNIKTTNQDSLLGRVYDTSLGSIAFGVICDGMGGLSNGELASATVIDCFEKWVETRLPFLLSNNLLNDEILSREWSDIVFACNENIKRYGSRIGNKLGTTLCAMLLTYQKYYVINVGDSRAYEISDNLRIITKDQTVVAQEVERGLLTEEQAKVDSRRSVLLQCIGASDVVRPDFFFGDLKSGEEVFMLCSDGFRHEISENELYSNLNASVLKDVNQMQNKCQFLINTCKQRNERDNISVLLIKKCI